MKAVIEKAETLGASAEGGKWVAFCETHSTLVNAPTKKELAGIETFEFCECCAGICSSIICPDCEKQV